MATKAVVSVLFFLTLARHGSSSQSYNAIYNFGDSISDTGNLCTGGCPSWLTNGQPPYGNTYFGRPTGRCSDGRVFVDFLGKYMYHRRTYHIKCQVYGVYDLLHTFAAEFFGLPLLPPSKANGTDFKKGANMAIIGATTMNLDFFQSHGLGSSIWNNGPLDTQIQWFQQLMPSICGSATGECLLPVFNSPADLDHGIQKFEGMCLIAASVDCKRYLNGSLFIVGEFGGNDYNAPIFGGKGLDEVTSYVPQIVDKITSSVEVQFLKTSEQTYTRS
jgi:hypothetical protein